MKKLILLFLFALCCQMTAQPVLYGTTNRGNGTISKYDISTNSLTANYIFQDMGRLPFLNSFCTATDGKLYGLIENGGIGFGVIASYDPSTGIYTKLKDFNGSDGAYPRGSLVQASDGKLYGMTSQGGSSGNNGVIFSYEPSTNIYTKLKDFNYSNGSYTLGSLIQASNGKLYGMTQSGGVSGQGVIFSYEPSTGIYAKLMDFNGSDGANPDGSFVQASNGKLYGMTVQGGSGGYGVVFSYDPSTGIYAKLKDFNNSDGAIPIGSLIQASDEKLYGMTSQGGSSGFGVVFSYDLATDNYVKLKDFNNSDGASPYGSLVQAGDGLLYGMTTQGGTSGVGVVFSYAPSTGSYIKLKDFNYTDGGSPSGNLVQSNDGNLYGMTSAGGSGRYGVIFSYTPSTNIYTKLKDFINSDGAITYGGLVQSSNGQLYGMTTHGGTIGQGVIFSYNPATDIYTKLKDFDNSNGASPYGSLVQAGNGRLYGMTFLGGSNGVGVIFSYDPSTGIFLKLKDLNYSDGAYPYGSLVQASDGQLYGMTAQGGSGGTGVIFSYELSTGIYTKLKDFNGSDGAYPHGSLVQAGDGKLYGTTLQGGSSNYGVVFSYDPSTGIYAKLNDFDSSNGAYPHGSLVQASNHKLYGMTTGGGSVAGVLFSYDITTGIFAKLMDFNSSEGYAPQGSLLQASDGKLYGMTQYGGSSQYGVVFSYDPTTNTYNKLRDFDGSNGGNPAYGALIEYGQFTPTITSFSPTSGTVGTTVTITGTNFNSTTSNNVVFFGATKATVTAATTSSLTVTVPTGATYAPITVLNTGSALAAYSLANFTPTFIPNKGSITAADFTPKVDFSPGLNPIFVAIGDLDGDGKPDLAIANQSSASVSVFRNLGNSGSIGTGSFAPKVDFTTGSGPISISIGDLDGDGKPDLAIANEGSSTISILHNTANPGSITSSSFAAKVDFTAGSDPLSVAISDLDGDGKPDLAVANGISNTLSVYHNTASPGSIGVDSFASKVDFNTGNFAYGLAIGDLDGDSKPELAVANYSSNSVSVFRNTTSFGSIGAGSFAAKVDFTTGSLPQSVAIGDLDGDGKPELAVANYSSATVSVIRNMTNPGSIDASSFAAKVDFSVNANAASVAIGDLDGDGKLDLSVANTINPGTVSILRNTTTLGNIGINSFASKVDFNTGNNSESITVGDLDGDGKPELVIANSGSSTISILRNNPVFPPTITSFSPTSGTVGTTVTITGTNFNSTTSNNVVFFGATRATVTAATTTSLTVTVPSGATYAPITVLNTGSALAAYSSADFTPTFTPNKGSITSADFTPKVDFTIDNFSYSVAIGDMDGDGKADLVLTNYGTNTVSVLRNTATAGNIEAGSFAEKIDFVTGTSPRGVALGDLDGDGKLELVVANFDSNTVSVLHNTTSPGNISSGSFAPMINFTTGSGPISVAINDLDGDGKPELAVANHWSSTISVFRNTAIIGSIDIGSFGDKVDFTSGGYPDCVAIGDLDGDGKPELAVANQFSSLSVFQNTATLGSIGVDSFASKVDFDAGSQPLFVAIGDLDGDGKPELVTVDYSSSAVSVFRNTAILGSIGANSFAAKVDFATGSQPYSVAIGDLDGDGKPDLAVPNINSNTVSIYRNTITLGNIGLDSFAAKVDFNTGLLPASAAIGDLDGDGMSDLAVANSGSAPYTVSVFRNNPVFPPTITSFSPSSGCANTSSLIITGTNFTNATAVKIGGINVLTFTVDSATTITATIGAGTTGLIEVTTPGGVALSVSNFTVIPLITYFRDLDGDGFGNIANTIQACSLPSGYVANSTDCNDININIHPGAVEICANGIDDNCNGVTDEACPPTLSINDVSVNEGAIATINVSLSSPSALPIKFNYTTKDGTATSKGKTKDYTTKNGTLTIPAGSISANITISIASDNILETTEYFDIVLSKATNATLLDNSGRVSIINGTAIAKEINPEFLVNIYPNPSEDQFTLEISDFDTVKEKVEITVYNIYGRLVYKTNGVKNSYIFGENFPPGMYIVDVRRGNENSVFKVIKN
ncbi:choice-of-anchor tandem repeat GloVer-containing protein [Flavobacterium sp. XS2P12]|uniref:choice-of-anchor tandem repeat GloVer-containing protein n=1 Tax=Flavobacterium melibiosi TaxID=3398734 RepID=UPI003A843E23